MSTKTPGRTVQAGSEPDPFPALGAAKEIDVESDHAFEEDIETEDPFLGVVTGVQFESYVQAPGAQHRTLAIHAKDATAIAVVPHGVLVTMGGRTALYPWSRIRQLGIEPQ